MARAKVTSTDIFARVARGECANFRNNACQGRTPCTVLVGESCEYFAKYVKPLLDYPEFSAKYAKEAKVSLLLNPKAKVVRQRRKAEEPALDLAPAATTPPAPKPRKAVAGKTPASSPPAATRAARTKTVAKKTVETVPAAEPKKTAARKTQVTAANAPKSTRTAAVTTGKAVASPKAATITSKEAAAKSAAPRKTAPVAKQAVAKSVVQAPVQKPEQARRGKSRPSVEETPITTTVTVDGDVRIRPASLRPAKRLKVAPAGSPLSGASIAPSLSEKPKVEQSQLTLDMFAPTPAKRAVGKRR
ncbi:MAG: hypothetical protein ACYC7E_12435 [Armatimonadota bacterium]